LVIIKKEFSLAGDWREEMEYINTHFAPEPSGHYSQAVVHAGLVFVSGQLPIDPKTGEKQLGTIEEQSARVLANLEAVLKASGSGKGKVIRVTVYVSNIVLWDRVNKVYADFFGDHKPARVVVPTRDLHYGFQIEMDAVAAVDVGESRQGFSRSEPHTKEGPGIDRY